MPGGLGGQADMWEAGGEAHGRARRWVGFGKEVRSAMQPGSQPSQLPNQTAVKQQPGSGQAAARQQRSQGRKRSQASRKEGLQAGSAGRLPVRQSVGRAGRRAGGQAGRRAGTTPASQRASELAGWLRKDPLWHRGRTQRQLAFMERGPSFMMGQGSLTSNL